LSQVRFQFDPGRKCEKLAIITDVGNDIAYSQDPQKVVRWVESLTAHLEAEEYRILVGGIPVTSLSRLNPRLFQALARLYYPDGRMSLSKVVEDLSQLERGLHNLCRDRNYPLISVQPEWYTFDNFHLKSKACFPYWQTLLRDLPVVKPYRSTWSVKARSPLFPRKYWLMGKERFGRERYPNLIPHTLTLVR
jgi:hypothetical protein